MEQPNAAAFRRRIAFTRTRKRKGFFSWPEVTFIMKDEWGSEIGQLMLRARSAVYTSTANPQAGMLLRKSLLTSKWFFTSDDTQEFGRFSVGWNFRPSFVFRSGERYDLRAKRRMRLSARKPGEPSQTATFMRDGVPVMLLENQAPMPLFSSETSVAMAGIISTNITDERSIAGLLILFQSVMDMRAQASH